MSDQTDLLAAQLEADIGTLTGVEIVYARHGFIPIARDVLGRIIPAAALPRVTIEDRDGTRYAEVTIGITADTSALRTAEQVREWITRELAENAPGPSSVLVRIATIG